MRWFCMLVFLLLVLSAITKVHAKLKCSNDLLMCLEMSCNDLTEENIDKNKDKINNLDDEGKAALHYAVQSGAVRCVKLLLEYGADPNLRTSEGQTTLQLVYAEEWSCEGCTLALLEGGADPSATDNHGQTAMFNLNLYKCPECMRHIVKWGGYVDAKRKDGETSLCLLVDEEEEIVKDVYKPYLNTLKELCADPTIKCSDGMTATEKARDFEHTYLIEFLEEYTDKLECKRNETKDGRDCVCKDGYLQWQDFYVYPVLGGECDEDKLQKMVQDGLDINGTDVNGHTGLTNAVINKQPACVELLLNDSTGAVNYPDDKGKTVLWYALKDCKSCSKNGIVELLLKKRANPYDMHGCSFLMDRELRICDECMEMLCKNGLDPLKECVDRGNPLHHICKEDVYMDPLLKHCSLATLKSKTTNKPAIWYTLKNCGGCEKDKCVQKLLKHGANVEDYTTEQGCNMMMDADLEICDQCVRLLHDHGFDTDGHVKTCTEGYALIWWCKNSDRDINVLLETCPNIENKDEQGNTALDISKKIENKECIKMIKSYRERSECTLGDVEEMPCDGKIQKSQCKCKNGTTLWNPPLCSKTVNNDGPLQHGGFGNTDLMQGGFVGTRLVQRTIPSSQQLNQHSPILKQSTQRVVQSPPNMMLNLPGQWTTQVSQQFNQNRPTLAQSGQWTLQTPQNMMLGRSGRWNPLMSPQLVQQIPVPELYSKWSVQSLQNPMQAAQWNAQLSQQHLMQQSPILAQSGQLTVQSLHNGMQTGPRNMQVSQQLMQNSPILAKSSQLAVQSLQTMIQPSQRTAQSSQKFFQHSPMQTPSDQLKNHPLQNSIHHIPILSQSGQMSLHLPQYLMQPNSILIKPLNGAIQLSPKLMLQQSGQWPAAKKLYTCLTGHQPFVNNCPWPMVASFIKGETASPFFKCILPTTLLNNCIWPQFVKFCQK